VEDVKHDLGFLANCRTRVKLRGNGPRELMMTGDRIYIAEYFSGTLGIVDLADPEKVASISLAPMEAQTTYRKGEQYFHDASFCYQNWISCTSCHPDGRIDAINWDLGNDGYGTLRQTKSLLLTHRTPPTTITGIRPNASFSVMSGFNHIEFTEVGDQVIQSVETYLLHMTPEMSPFLEEGKLSEQAESGLVVYRKAKCISCHSGPAFTDAGMHLVGNGYSEDEKFDTPTLLETWRTGPYLHDGRAVDLKSMLVEHNKDNLHGETMDLTAKEVDDLVEYVLSISSMAPVIISPVQDIKKQQGFATETIALEGVFSDEDSELLSFQVNVEHPEVVEASLSGSELILRESGPGSTVITITAQDGAGGFVDHHFTVLITYFSKIPLFADLQPITRGIFTLLNFLTTSLSAIL
jgi:cytochrome c peroxidase